MGPGRCLPWLAPRGESSSSRAKPAKSSESGASGMPLPPSTRSRRGVGQSFPPVDARPIAGPAPRGPRRPRVQLRFNPSSSARQLGLPKLDEATRELLELLLPPPDETLVDREPAPHVSVGPFDRKSVDARRWVQRGEGNGVRFGAIRRDHVEITSDSISRWWNGDQLRLEDTGVHLRTMASGRLARPSLGAVDVAKRVDPFRSSGWTNDTLGTEVHLRRLASARHESEASVHVDVRTQALRRDRHRFDRRRFEWLCSELLE